MTGNGGDDEKPNKPRRHRAGVLSDEDRRIWEHVARSVEPSRRRRGRVAEGGALKPPSDHPEKPSPQPQAPAMGRKGEAAADTDQHNELLAELRQRLERGAGLIGSQASDPAPSPGGAGRGGRASASRHQPPPVNDFDRKAARRIRSGRTEIEARIDLHGMRQSEAHSALRSFLHGCHARGVRWVLVITGKGRPSRAWEADHDDTASGARRGRDDRPSWHDDERGVLKRNVPRWLAEPDLRSIVVSYTTASPPHGGEGALYVHLRARR